MFPPPPPPNQPVGAVTQISSKGGKLPAGAGAAGPRVRSGFRIRYWDIAKAHNDLLGCHALTLLAIRGIQCRYIAGWPHQR